MDAPHHPERTGWRRFLTTRVVRLLVGAGVVAAAAVVVPTLTSEPNHDKAAVETAGRPNDGTVRLDEHTDDAALELPSELTTVPATDVTKATTASTKASGATSTTKVTAGPGSTSPSTPATSSTTQATAPSSSATTQPPAAGCGYSRDTAAEDRIVTLFGQRRPDMSRTGSMDATARSWACNMAGRQTADHMSPFVPNRTDQIFAACGGCAAVAENVAFNSSADAAWQSWLNSSTHLANIDQAGAGTFGIAAYRNGSSIYFVHVFGHG
jgi:uncharacterized protein YkwD